MALVGAARGRHRRGLVGHAGPKLNAAADPRAKLLRKRRWAFRLGVFFTVSAVFWVGVTALLASWSTPVWALFIPSPIAVGAAFLATLAFLRYRWLRVNPCRRSGPAVGGCRRGGRPPVSRWRRWPPPNAGCRPCWG